MREAAQLSAPCGTELHAPFQSGGFLAAGRFQVRRRIGRGGMGTVYEAYDAERRSTVALKLLSRVTPEGLYRFKNEFRTLIDIRHRNLVQLHELFSSDASWYYTMELVRGTDLVRYTRPVFAGASEAEAQLSRDRGGALFPVGQLVEERARSCLSQLVAALAAVHGAGKLHRDLKPSNVLVTAEGKLVLLDFGLSIDAQPGGIGQTQTETALCGTPAYLSPEQAAGRPATVASDLYSLGVLLFEVLTGRLPFEGTSGELLAAKQRDLPPLAATIDPNAPADLALLCHALLSIDPQARPSLAKLCAHVGGDRTLQAQPPLASAAPLLRLHGREEELSLLRDAYRATLTGQAVLLSISGESGAGKTSLAQAFLSELSVLGSAVVLAGRCYERESVPYKLFDPLVDAMTRTLRKVLPGELAALGPEQAAALMRLFPVLERVFSSAAPTKLPTVSPQELQELAFDAFGALLAKLRKERPLVLLVDDVQWSDTDSLRFLQGLLTQVSPVPLLFVLSHRSVPSAQATLNRLLTRCEESQTLQVHRLVLGPLSDSATAELARDRLPDALRDNDAVVERVVRGAEGNPFFAITLAEGMQQSAPELPGAIAAALAQRLERLPEAALRLLQLLALVGEPLLARAALEAASATHDDLELLRSEHWTRSGASHGAHGVGAAVECYHDRIREYVAGRLTDAQRRSYGSRLADVLLGLDDVSADLLRRCLVDAGRSEAALQLAIEGADRALATFAFDRAAALYAEALERLDTTDERRLLLTKNRGDALAHGGLGHDAAHAYQAAARLCSGDESLNFLRMAAEQLLTTGHLAEGHSLLATLCERLDVPFPRSALAAGAQLAWTSARLRLRGLTVSAPVAETKMLRLDTAYTAVFGFLGYLPIHALAAINTYLLLALDAASELHWKRAVAIGSDQYGEVNPNGALARKLRALVEAGDPNTLPAHERGYASYLSGTTCEAAGRHADARAHFREALELLQHKQLEAEQSFVMLADAARLHDQICAYELGQLAEIARTTPGWIDRAFQRGRVWAGVTLSGLSGLPAWLVPNDTDTARRRLDEAHLRWRAPAGFHTPDLLLLLAEVHLAWYAGDPALAFSMLQMYQKPIYQLARFSEQRYKLYLLEGCSAAAVLRSEGARGHRRREMRQIVGRSIERISKAKTKLPGRFMLEAALAHDDGDVEHMVRCLQKLQQHGNRLPDSCKGAALDLRLGQLLGGDEGKTLTRRAVTVLDSHGVKNRDAMARMLMAGFDLG